MNEQSVRWDEFADVVSDLRVAHDSAAGEREPILFRGQPDATWGLETSLERFSARSWTAGTYSLAATSCLPKLEAFLGKSLNVDSRRFDEIVEALRSNSSTWIPTLPDFAYWTYLRHHGFPSPLLDWSASPYVAAFFAFDDCQRTTDEVAVFAYWGRFSDVQWGEDTTPHLTRIGSRVQSDMRHFSQQCSYTVATKFERNRHVFVPHESAGQNLEKMVKLKLPASDRIKALRALKEYNISRFTLFHTIDDLVRTLGFEELELGQY